MQGKEVVVAVAKKAAKTAAVAAVFGGTVIGLEAAVGALKGGGGELERLEELEREETTRLEEEMEKQLVVEREREAEIYNKSIEFWKVLVTGHLNEMGRKHFEKEPSALFVEDKSKDLVKVNEAWAERTRLLQINARDANRAALVTVLGLSAFFALLLLGVCWWALMKRRRQR
jgi:hypothetical protein